jgi:hypothetical protein
MSILFFFSWNLLILFNHRFSFNTKLINKDQLQQQEFKGINALFYLYFILISHHI